MGSRKIAAIVEDNEAALRTICRRRHVKKLELFGSAVTEAFHPDSSDLDFLVEFQTLENSQLANAYFGLLTDLRDLFRRPIDLVMPEAIENKYFQEAVDETRTAVYAA